MFNGYLTRTTGYTAPPDVRWYCSVSPVCVSFQKRYTDKINKGHGQRASSVRYFNHVCITVVMETLISTVSLRGLSFVSSTCALEHSLSVFTGDTHVGQVLSLTFMSLCGLCLCPFNRVLNDFTLIRSRQGFQPTDSFTISISLHKLATSDTVCKRRRHIS